MNLTVQDAAAEVRLSIPGLAFERNTYRHQLGPEGWFSSKLSSSPGPLISDFVTHELGFHYSTYGIHIGQEDRLTFLGKIGQQIAGHFVDCRSHSPTLHGVVDITFTPNLERRLVIPRGVAHTFDNLDGIVTRDEPVWYSDEDNDAWNIDNDLIAIPRETHPSLFPVVRGNRHQLPDAAHVFMSKLSQSLLENPRAYLARYLLRIGGKQQFVMFEPTSWAKDDIELRSLIPELDVPGVQIKRARYALTGPRSWTLVPSTSACVADVLFLPSHTRRPETLFLHARTRKWYTVLNSEGRSLTLTLVDCRTHSASRGLKRTLTLACDPRLVIVIDPGIAYSMQCETPLVVRSEHEVYADTRDPRDDIPVFGQDLVAVPENGTATAVEVANLRCPDALVYAIAKHESLASLSHESH